MHYVVSDIHNDYQKFCELLKMIEFSKEDKANLLETGNMGRIVNLKNYIRGSDKGFRQCRI